VKSHHVSTNNVISCIVKEFVPLSAIGWISLVTSTAILVTGNVKLASQLMGRSEGNLIGIIGSYFVHGDWQHLTINIIAYTYGVMILYSCAKYLHKRGVYLSYILNWKKWNLLELSLAALIGIIDLMFNKLYKYTNIPAVGMSDLVSAILFGGIMLSHALRFSINTIESNLKKALYIVILFNSLLLVVSNTYSALMAGVNILAHMYGISVSPLVFFIPLYELKIYRNMLVVILILLSYLGIIVGIYLVTVIFRL